MTANLSENGCLSLASSLVMNLLAIFFGGLTLLNKFLYPHSYSSHPVLSKTVDLDVLLFYGILSMIGIGLSCAALIILLIALKRSRVSSKQRTILLLFISLSTATLLFCVQRYGWLSEVANHINYSG